MSVPHSRDPARRENIQYPRKSQRTTKYPIFKTANSRPLRARALHRNSQYQECLTTEHTDDTEKRTIIHAGQPIILAPAVITHSLRMRDLQKNSQNWGYFTTENTESTEEKYIFYHETHEFSRKKTNLMRCMILPPAMKSTAFGIISCKFVSFRGQKCFCIFCVVSVVSGKKYFCFTLCPLW
jgi:hypothetical protein